MNKENANKWIAALKSGEFDQTTLILKSSTEDRYCCLGVAAVVMGETIPDVGAHDRVYSAVREWLGIDTAESQLYMHLNDCERRSFIEIAEYTEEKLRLES